MPDQPRDILTDHEYDGIREYDNPTPGWWWAIFWMTILFTPPYFFIVLAAQGVLSPEGQYERAKTAVLAQKFGEIGELTPDQQTILSYAQDEGWMAFAANTYAGKCAQCHGVNGQGMSGPNLTDQLYINVETVEDIYDVIANGRNNNAMPAWKNQLHRNEMVLLSSYVTTLRGQDLPGGRAPDPRAKPIDPWPELADAPAGEAEADSPQDAPNPGEPEATTP